MDLKRNALYINKCSSCQILSQNKVNGFKFKKNIYFDEENMVLENPHICKIVKSVKSKDTLYLKTRIPRKIRTYFMFYI